MPKKIKNVKKIKESRDIDLSPEETRLYENRVYRFKDILGREWPKEQINALVDSTVDYHDLEELVKNGCSPELAIKILI